VSFDELYQEIILEHYRHPRNKAELGHLRDAVVRENPACGDSIRLEARFDRAGKLSSLRYDGRGCAISTASASMMSELLAGLPAAEARQRVDEILGLLRGGPGAAEKLASYGDLAALAGVIKFPVRVKCASLAWHAAAQALREV